MRRRGGFTVIELVAVIVFVLIVGAMLVPIFARPDRHNHDNYCQSNLKQIGLAFHMYLNDWDGHVPQNTYRLSGRDIRWEDALLLYLKNDRLYLCPLRPPYRSGQSDYGVNQTYLMPLGLLPTVAQKDIKEPVLTILAGDQGDLRRGLFSPVTGGGSAMAPACNVPLRHTDGVNFVFVDGHVKWEKAGGAWSKDDTLWDLK